jgi:hypothetical protein
VVEAEGSDDMDLFVALQKLDRDGQPLGQTFYAFFEDGPVALGWLRASHRETDPVRSTRRCNRSTPTFANSGWRRAKSCRWTSRSGHPPRFFTQEKLRIVVSADIYEERRSCRSAPRRRATPVATSSTSGRARLASADAGNPEGGELTDNLSATASKAAGPKKALS